MPLLVLLTLFIMFFKKKKKSKTKRRRRKLLLFFFFLFAPPSQENNNVWCYFFWSCILLAEIDTLIKLEYLLVFSSFMFHVVCDIEWNDLFKSFFFSFFVKSVAKQID